jgi:amidase
MKIMADDRLDAIVYPHQQRLVVPIGETQVERNGALASVTGFPAIVVPGGFSSPTPTATIGVPVGLEFLGRPWSEPVLIEIAYGYEQATKHRRPPTIPPSPSFPNTR